MLINQRIIIFCAGELRYENRWKGLVLMASGSIPWCTDFGYHTSILDLAHIRHQFILDQGLYQTQRIYITNRTEMFLLHALRKVNKGKCRKGWIQPPSRIKTSQPGLRSPASPAKLSWPGPQFFQNGLTTVLSDKCHSMVNISSLTRP